MFPDSEHTTVPSSLIDHLFIHTGSVLNGARDSWWQTLSPARRLGGTLWPRDAALFQTVKYYRQLCDSTRSKHKGRAVGHDTQRVCYYCHHYTGSTGGHAPEMTRHTRNRVIIINPFILMSHRYGGET